MKFEIITIFPRIFDSYINESIIKRARDNGLIDIKTYNLRDWTTDKHHTVDDTPYGGGAGMVMKIGILYKALRDIQNHLSNLQFSDKQQEIGNWELGIRGTNFPPKYILPNNSTTSPVISNSKLINKETSSHPDSRFPIPDSKTILLSAKGKRWNQAMAQEYSKLDSVVLLCGRYEGVDERVTEFIDEEISIGDYVLTGGEIGAMIMIDSIARLLPGVLGNVSSAINESHSEPGLLEYPQYTRPEIFTDDKGQEHKVPDVLLSGNHAEIEKWRKRMMRKI